MKFPASFQKWLATKKIVKAFQQEQATQETFEALNQTLYEKKDRRLSFLLP